MLICEKLSAFRVKHRKGLKSWKFQELNILFIAHENIEMF